MSKKRKAVNRFSSNLIDPSIKAVTEMVQNSFQQGFTVMKQSKLNFIEGPGNKVKKKEIPKRIKIIIKVLDKIT
jgi:hypothetical protein